MKKTKLFFTLFALGGLLLSTKVMAQEVTNSSNRAVTSTTIEQSSDATEVSSEQQDGSQEQQTTEQEQTNTKETIEKTTKKFSQQTTKAYYGTVINPNETIWQDKELTISQGKTETIYHGTYFIEEEIIDENNQKSAYLLADKNHEKQGYVSSSVVEVTENIGGVPIKLEKYGTVKNKNYSLWKNLELTEKIKDKQELAQKTFLIKNEYHHFNGSIYYELYNNQNEFIGFMAKEDISLENNAGGSYISTWKYGTVTKKNYSLWQNFSFSQERNNSTTFYQQTLLMKGEYHHFNGSIYYSVYDNQDNWLGYINKEGITISENRGGIYISTGKYVTLTKKNYSMWNNLDFSQERNNSTKYYEQTMLAKGEYHHFNGLVYYSIYNNKNEWLGYINKGAVSVGSGRGGSYIPLGKYGTVSKKGYSMWNNFSFDKERNNTTRFNQQTFLIKGKYHHYNGSVYYSVYDNQDRWLGYTNKEAIPLATGKEGNAVKVNQTIALPDNNYPIWQNFSWKKKNNTNNVSKKKYTVNYQYHHFNGDIYSSVYDNNKWIGYLNQKGSKTWQEKNGVTYIDNIMISNKKIKLPSYFNPGEDGEAGRQVRSMIYAMQNAGMMVSNSYSGFRTYQYQESLYNDYVRINGQAKTDTFCARPGHSEHQTGLTFDLLHSNGTLIETGREANWLSQNAHKYGFIIRYKASKTPITGYQGEPWHVRYIGKNQAEKIMKSNQCLEEYLGVEGGNYR